MSEVFAITGQTRTASGSRYLRQLCKHWSHKAESEFSPTSGGITFASGERVVMSATEEHLRLIVSAASPIELDAFVDVVETHISRFAFRETLEFEWQA